MSIFVETSFLEKKDDAFFREKRSGKREKMEKRNTRAAVMAVVARPVFIRELSIFFQPCDTDVVVIATSIPIIISPGVLSTPIDGKRARASFKDKKEKEKIGSSGSNIWVA